ncbi:MAG: FMN-binding protein [Clostridia bacterium]|nr:FMN-binding protein [Clostridia bacterium]
MKKEHIYTIVFMFIVSGVFTLFLAASNAYYLPVIKKNAELSRNKSILSAFGIESKDGSLGKAIEMVKVNGTEIYVKRNEDNTIEAYAVPFTGSGLWGSISGYLAVSSDFAKIVGVDFTSHSETPGLGGRIDEKWFKEQFRGLSIDKGKPLVYKAGSEGDVDAITGATSTSKSVLQILNNVIESDLSRLEVK